MHPDFFGDSYDLVKREIIHGLAPAEQWTVHPMYFDFGNAPKPGFVLKYAKFLGIQPAARETERSNLVDDVTAASLQQLFLDPDTGLWDGQGSPGGAWRKHISVRELARIANARKHGITLVFDQSYSRTLKNQERRTRVEQKLKALRNTRGERQVHSVAYVSHAVFIWVSTDADLLASATQRLLARSGLPRARFTDDRCGGNHIGT